MDKDTNNDCSNTMKPNNNNYQDSTLLDTSESNMKMNRYQEIQNMLNREIPLPVDLPKLYFLGDTGAGKTTIIRKFLGTEESNFPTTRQKRTTVAPTEYVIRNSDHFDIAVVLKSIEEIKGYIDEIIKEAIRKYYEDRSKEKILKNIRQTSDQRFRLYYLLSESFLEQIAEQIENLFPHIKLEVKKLQKNFPDDRDIGIFVELAIDELGESYLQIRDGVMDEIQKLTSEVCGGKKLKEEWEIYKYKTQSREGFIQKCKSLLSSERISVSPVIEHARIQGNLKSTWLDSSTEAVVIDSEGIGHDTREAGQLDSRHYDYFYDSDAILLIEESEKPFVAGGKNALKSIFQRGYGDKLRVLFTKLDKVEPYDCDNPGDFERIEDVKDGLQNVLASLKKEGQNIDLKENHIFFLGGLKHEDINEKGQEIINNIFHQAGELSRREHSFVEPKYDFEMLSPSLFEFTKKFNDLYKDMLSKQHYNTIKAFNRRMVWGIDGFRMFTPITDFEEKINKEIEEFISSPYEWEQEASENLQKESLNSIRRQLNKLVIDFAHKEIIRMPHMDWQKALSHSGPGSTAPRKKAIESILENVAPAPPSATAQEAKRFKDSIKSLLKESILKCKSHNN